MRLTPELVLRAYAGGVFPMAETAQATEIHWFEPRRRGVMPLDGFHIARSLRRTRRRGGFRFRCDGDFGGVVAACADRPETWINADIERVFLELHALGLAHSIEVLCPDGRLAGGVYGLAMGGAFFAESMVSRVTGGSKMALAELVARLVRGGYRLMDTQYLTPHLASLGGVEIARADYRRRLAEALATPADAAHAFARTNPEAPDGAFWSEEPVDRKMPDQP
ncbi:MAG: leucyl/phenylalanyl-tRNA--protein transferase [Rhodobacter sp.]|uniref:leucyl/phenylalanyl-tRNA--protein transferase n=1 Tax=Pararhodobacter sp. TaxID=2127056 RepID=UPI001E14B69A|nr:leucyl/phenylalanyl-tRNA--protein transferase [Pararhodobacter sp.]MCB1343721.1 leucyl/phenylalanyl-tRNA--protein transferase [Paracoccaceae bacterium]MCC0074508.1 leucyl/phenylalanyl-tRNA--protein transferase [Rhodobacter sp.]HPD91876.1 leucyl/phenylalanyl-tRNA--protein transferase [Pararhodobacter sp.]